ncbi:Molecular chaperone IbpA, HSP20 family [Desulfonatronum thiosulfatophilum]|uniref:Molecular chaperone IbpA, HSP20 family n=1 Tax=Desulfonatronum thiosulfatophilum TaxID=617002 RepID=A0A1G6B6S5_9BACT|nr:Hsp20/alpha crystallin family protein [Desulfonatronum thiosulfatophilum]SDB16350.1 Molecular chaperone IbpA, HSP20 family [Desulfonatronum thiosulfatophilum]
MNKDIVQSEAKGLPRMKPATDILETGDGFFIYVDMPGVSKEELIIDLSDDELRIGGKSTYQGVTNENRIHVEFGNVEYTRAFTLSHIVDREKIKATLKNGVLELHLPKAEKALPRKIQVEAE